MSRTLEIDFVYPILVRRPYRRIDEKRFGRARTEVVIEEVSDSDAPLVARVGNPRGFYSRWDPFDRGKDGALKEIRLFDGRFHVEWGKFSDLVQKIRKPLNRTPFDFRREGEIDQRFLEPIRPPYSVSQDDGGKSIAESLSKRATELFVVTGNDRVYARCSEPILSLSATAASIVQTTLPVMSLKYENLVDATQLLARHGANLVHRAEWEIIDPTAFHFNGPSFDVFTTAKQVQAHLTRVDNPSRELLLAFGALRDALDDAVDRTTRRLVEALEWVSTLDTGANKAVNLQALHAQGRASEMFWPYEYLDMSRQTDSAVHDRNMEQAIMSARAALERWANRSARGWEDQGPHVSSIRKGDLLCKELLSTWEVSTACTDANLNPSPIMEMVGSRRLFTVMDYARERRSLCAVGIDGAVEILGGTIPTDISNEMVTALMSAQRSEMDMSFDAPDMARRF